MQPFVMARQVEVGDDGLALYREPAGAAGAATKLATMQNRA